MLLFSVAVSFEDSGEHVSETNEFLQQAIAFRDAGDFPSAVNQLKNALQRSPEHGRARALLAELYVEIGDGASAEKELAAARRVGVETEVLWVLSGRALLLQGRFDEALGWLVASPPAAHHAVEAELIRGESLLGLNRSGEAVEAFSSALALRPDNPLALISLAEALTAMNRPGQAEAQLDRSLAIDPQSARALFLKGELRRSSGDPSTSIEHFDQAIQLDAEAIAPRLGRISALIDLNEDIQARDEIDDLKERFGNDPMVQYLDAVILARQGHYRAAQSALQRIDRFVNEAPSALLFRATLHYVLGEFEQCRVLLGRLQKSEPDSLPPLKLMVATLIKQGKLTSAIELLQSGLELAPDDPQIHFLFGSAYLQLHDYRNASQALERAVAASPGDLRAITQIAFGQMALAGSADGIQARESAPRSEADFLLVQFLEGLGHLQLGEFAQAITVAKDLEDGSPAGPLGPYLRGSAYLAQGRSAEARASLLRTAERFPGFVPAQINLGKLELEAGQTENAAKRALEVLERQPDNIEAQLLRAEVFRRTNQLEVSRELLERAINQAPRALEPVLALIALQFDLGDGDAARKLAEKARREHPSDVRALSTFADVELRVGHLADAAAAFAKLSELQPDVVSYSYRAADAYQELGDLTAAKSQLLTLVKTHPRQIAARLRLVEMALAEGKIENALFQLDRLTEANPESSAADQARGDFLLRLGRAEEAEEAFTRAWRKQPRSELAVALYRARSAVAEPISSRFVALQEWLQGHPGDTETRLFLANELLDTGHHKMAIKEFEIILAKNPGDAISLNNLAWLYHEVSDPRAVTFAERAVAAAPSEAAIIDTLGWILLRQGNLVRAETLLRAAADRAPDNPEIGYHLAVALLEAGRPEEARLQLEHILSSQKEFDSAQAAKDLRARLKAN